MLLQFMQQLRVAELLRLVRGARLRQWWRALHPQLLVLQLRRGQIPSILQLPERLWLLVLFLLHQLRRDSQLRVAGAGLFRQQLCCRLC